MKRKPKRKEENGKMESGEGKTMKKNGQNK
jgi:hypothetical protein